MLTAALCYVIPFVIVLSALVFVHEFGHYVLARRNDVAVTSFAIGFGPELVGWNDGGGTRWKICLLPLGGCVNLEGMTEPGDQGNADGWFCRKSLGQRTAIVAGGPAANFTFAFALLVALFLAKGVPFVPPVVVEVAPLSPAAAAGVVPGDRMLAVNGTPVETSDDVDRLVRKGAGAPIKVTLRRDGQAVAIDIAPRQMEMTDSVGAQRQVILGIRHGGTEYVAAGPVRAVLSAAAA